MNELTKETIDQLKNSYISLNLQRLSRCLDVLPATHQDFISIAPLLLHMNDPKMPGYLSKEVPACISGYFPTKEAKEAGRRLIDARFNMVNNLALSMDLHGLFLVNMAGTLTFNERNSGIELWIIVDPKVTQKGRELLAEKVQLIERWAIKKDIPAHFVIYDPNNLGENINQNLVLDQFYAHSILVAGRLPIWWLIDEQKNNYNDSLNQILADNLIDQSEFINLGSVSLNIDDNHSTIDFLKATIWQIILDIEFPYSSLLNLLLMEIYIQQIPKIGFVSSKMKQTLLAGESDINKLDAGFLLLQNIESYLTDLDDPERIQLIRRCFYVQAKEKRDETKLLRKSDWHQAFISDLVSQWGWDNKQKQFLEQRDKWKISDFLPERELLLTSLFKTHELIKYQLGLNFEDKPLTILIEQLGHKIETSYGKKEGKIDYLNPHILYKSLGQKQLTIIQIQTLSKQESWLLFTGSVTPESCKTEKPIITSHYFLELVSWGVFNQLIRLDTYIHVYSQQYNIPDRSIRKIIEFFQSGFPANNSGFKSIGQAPLKNLSEAEKITHMALFVNFGLDSFKDFKKDGKEMMTDIIDAFNFSSQKVNIAHHFELIRYNNWQEAIYERSIDGASSLIKCLCNCLEWGLPKTSSPALNISIFVLDSGREILVHMRVEELFKDMFDYFYHHKSPQAARYVMQVENTCLIFYLKNGSPTFLKTKNIKAMESLFSMPQPKPCAIKIGPHFFEETPFPAIFNVAKMFKIQLYYFSQEKKTDIYVVDEKGSLFHEQVKDATTDRLIQRYLHFLSITAKRLEAFLPEFDSPKMIKNIRCYELMKDADGKLAAVPKDFQDYTQTGVFSIRVAAENLEQAKTAITVHYDDQEFSSVDHAEKIFSILAKDILSRRKNGDRYPIYITDLDVTPNLLGLKDPLQAQTLHYLNSKKKLEARINKYIV